MNAPITLVYDLPADPGLPTRGMAENGEIDARPGRSHPPRTIDYLAFPRLCAVAEALLKRPL